MNKIVTIQDISCIGKCSLTVALPIISALGIEAAIIPTAVLSTHTAFDNFTFCDLTDNIMPIARHWKKEGFNFDAIYTGYLGSKKQIDIVIDFADQFKKNDTVLFVDPVMGDNGKLYKGFDNEFVQEMKKLCKKADIIAPNMTEAALLLGIEYKPYGYDEKYVKNIMLRLCEMGCKTVILTGVSIKKENIGVMTYDSEKNTFYNYNSHKVPFMCHGTGDIFSSTFIGLYTSGFGIDKSAELAAEYTAECIKSTLEDKEKNWYGVNFESKIPYLIERKKQLDNI